MDYLESTSNLQQIQQHKVSIWCSVVKKFKASKNTIDYKYEN